MQGGKKEDANEGSWNNRRSSMERRRPSSVQQQPSHVEFYCQRRHQAPLLPLPSPPPLLSHLPPSHNIPRSMTTSRSFVSWKKQDPAAVITSPDAAAAVALLPLPRAIKEIPHREVFEVKKSSEEMDDQALISAQRRPDAGGAEGLVIPLLANHFHVQFDPSQEIFHYDVDIVPRPSKEIARMIKSKLVQGYPAALSGAKPAFDGRRNLYSPIEFQNDRLEFFVSLPISASKSLPSAIGTSCDIERQKLFRVSVRLVSRICGSDLSKYIQDQGDSVPLPQDYLHALDVVLREGPVEKCIPVGRCLYSSSMEGVQDIGGGAIGLRGFFQSLRATQNGLALNVDFSVMAFHESIGIIPYLQKRFDFLWDLSKRKSRGLVGEEKREVEKALKNIRVFACHRETEQRYRVFGLTDEATENLKFSGRDGKDLMLVDYFKDQYNHDIEFRKLPCLQISRSKPCYLPMELCMVCEGQKYLGKLSNDQLAKIIKMGSQKPKERKNIINRVVGGPIGPLSGCYADEFDLQVSRAMTQLRGRVLQPPKLKLGQGGNIKDLIPDRKDRQWSMLDSHVAEGSQIKRWAVISFGGTIEQRSCIPGFINHLSSRCEQLGIFLSKKTAISPVFEQIQVLSNVSVLEQKLRKSCYAALNNLQLILFVLERRHKGYADLKRIAETDIGVVSQCCLFSNVWKPSSQFLANLALKINAKLGGSNVILYNTLPCQIPRLFTSCDPVIFMGADVTHPHPLDDSSPSVAAVVASVDWPAASKYISKMRSQTHRQEIIEDLEDMVSELLKDFQNTACKLPNRIIFFRDGVSETQFRKVLNEELKAIRAACSRFASYKPSITFTVVQKRHHTRLFHNDGHAHGASSSCRSSDGNIPPGTVVDTIITHPREFDFYLCSHWGMKGTSRPTHYHVLWDENHFTSDELQKLIHNLCYTFARCTKPVSIVPPAYYAHLAAYRGRLYLQRSDSTSPSSKITMSRSGLSNTIPLPKLRDNVKKLMFYC